MKAGWIALLLSPLALAATVPAVQVDLIIRGGTVYTGTDAPFVGDVAVSGDRVHSIGRRLALSAARVIDARRMIVAPGFIDPHTHAGDQLASDDRRVRLIPAFLMQGVTTAFIGNDGGGAPDVAVVLGNARHKPAGINHAAYVGFGAVRTAVVGEADRAPTPDELERMKQMVASAMCQGALGLSTGLFYAPQSFATTQEVTALAREAGRRGGVYDSHLRDESSYSIGLAAAVDEAIAIGRDARLPSTSPTSRRWVSTSTARHRRSSRGSRPRARAGQRVTADQYPVGVGHDLARRWCRAGRRTAGARRCCVRFADPAWPQLAPKWPTTAPARRAASLLITEGDKGRRRSPRRRRPIRRSRLPSSASARSSGRVVPKPDGNRHRRIHARPWVMTGSDASTGHPRAFGSFARKYAEYVVRRRVVSLRDFIERSTRLTADTFGLADRGRLRRGAFADIVVFDPRTYRRTPLTSSQPCSRAVCGRCW
jgi:N-acyl-D-aspartate/D-glutamate deacylase